MTRKDKNHTRQYQSNWVKAKRLKHNPLRKRRTVTPKLLAKIGIEVEA